MLKKIRIKGENKKMRIGINGFGRIGRLILRNTLQRKDADVVAVNDPFVTLDYAAYMLTYDTVHGKLNADIKIDEAKGKMIVDIYGIKCCFKDAISEKVIKN